MPEIFDKKYKQEHEQIETDLHREQTYEVDYILSWSIHIPTCLGKIKKNVQSSSTHTHQLDRLTTNDLQLSYENNSMVFLIGSNEPK